MKKAIILTVVSACCVFSLSAQMRALKQEEITYFNKLYPVLYAAVPHTYQDWKALGDKKDFDAVKFFCPDGDAYCQGKCPVSLGKGDPYSLSYKIDFTMPDDKSAPMAAGAYKQIKDFNNATQIATAFKSTAKSKLSINIFVNISGGADAPFVLNYCGKSQPEKLTLPVPATLALLGKHSEECPYMNSGRPDMSPGDGYYDDAIVFLGKSVTGQKNDERHDGQTRTAYAVGFDKLKIGSPVTQNIVVQFRGDAADINEAIKLVDWKALYALLNK